MKNCQCAIDRVAPYGMPVGEEIFETVYWSGPCAQSFGADNVQRVPRLKVKLHLCHDPRAKDANIRQALIDRFAKPGTKKEPSILYGITGDLWAALALEVTWWTLTLPSPLEQRRMTTAKSSNCLRTSRVTGECSKCTVRLDVAHLPTKLSCVFCPHCRPVCNSEPQLGAISDRQGITL